MESNQRLSCFLIGSDSLLIECAETLLSRGHSVLGVISDTPRLQRWAREKGVAVYTLSCDYRAAMAAQPFDYLFSITHLAVIPGDVLACPRRGTINFHDGPLPRYAGLHTPAWGLMRGEREWAITFHRVTADLDRGDVLAQVPVTIAPDETSFTLNAKCFEAGISAFQRLVDDLAAGGPTGRPQEPTGFTYFARHQRPPAACLLDWTRPAEELEAFVRALDFGRYPNPLGSPKILRGDDALLVTRARATENGVGGAPGTVRSANEDGILVETAHGGLLIQSVADPEGRGVGIPEVIRRWRLAAGERLDRPADDAVRALTERGESISRAERYWTRRLIEFSPVELPYVRDAAAGAAAEAPVETPRAFLERYAGRTEAALVAAVGVYLSRLADSPSVQVGYRDDGIARGGTGLRALFGSHIPLVLSPDLSAPFDAAVAVVQRLLDDARRRGPYLRDVVARTPELEARARSIDADLRRVAIECGSERAVASLTFRITATGVVVASADGAVRPEDAESMGRQLRALLDSIVARAEAPLGAHDVLGADERRRLLEDWNRTARPLPEGRTLVDEFESQARRTPGAPAVACGSEAMTYAELNACANRLAHRLRSMGVGPESRVGVAVERSPDMAAAVLGVLKSGGAYVPLDPEFPSDRVRFMVQDGGLSAVLVGERAPEGLGGAGVPVVRVGSPELDGCPAGDPAPLAHPENAAYVIYTSGSTGKPKGVIVEHRNVVNFFVGMDERLGHHAGAAPGTWLAVTSLSFDISVLELLWTLSRGFKVVIYRDAHKGRGTSARSRTAAAAPASAIEFSLFYFAADEGGQGADRYRLLLEGARFADRHGFAAVWTPERHFHAFGGLYPNPSVAGGALAFVTERVQIRAGSVVLPLHHPARVAEEWALVDNLSRGRVGVAFASGWQPVDFVLRPEAYAKRQQLLYESIETVRRLWRGEAVEFPGPDGKPAAVRTLPRPVQPELPVWITTAGSLETWLSAARIGANVLTHLLGQTVDEIADKVRRYREEFAKHHPGRRGVVTIMLHTFVGEDDNEVKEIVREPMVAYLGASLSLVKNVASSWAAFKRRADGSTAAVDLDLKSLTTEEMRDLLEFSFERYFETSGLFGTPETCLAMVGRLSAAGIDEIACLVDFGVETETALRHLDLLNEVRARAARAVRAAPATEREEDESIGALIARHGVTHLQCTPSMARMILMDDAARDALSRLRVMMVGGEALPGALAADLRRATGARLLNMYGPTETTIWSSTHTVAPTEGTVPIGTPIANTELYVLDRAGRPKPVGIPGELFIGGLGVARGYHNRPELTGERFVPDPFSARPGARLYRTGDVARWRSDGVMEFLGRADQQVKIRGHRIELGEIESAVTAVDGVREAAVLLREDAPGDQRLVAYAVARSAPAVSEESVRAALRATLPEYMVPAHVVFMPALPLTPNKKVDRKALPKPEGGATAARPSGPPASQVEEQILVIWREVLGVADPGVADNFFDLGGHSLLAVKAHRRLKEAFQRDLAITDLFRFPTARALAAFLSEGGSDRATQESRDRAGTRREMLQRRQQRVRTRAGGPGDGA